jgi:hypothetical protein
MDRRWWQQRQRPISLRSTGSGLSRARVSREMSFAALPLSDPLTRPPSLPLSLLPPSLPVHPAEGMDDFFSEMKVPWMVKKIIGKVKPNMAITFTPSGYASSPATPPSPPHPPLYPRPPPTTNAGTR